MPKVEWYRRETWTDADQMEFEARLKRSRDVVNKSQYLCIQAHHLAEAGEHAAAIQLADRALREFPVRTQQASAYLRKAKSLAALGEIDAAVDAFRAGLQTEREFPNVRTTAWLDFGWLVVEQGRTPLYAEAAQVIEEFREENGIQFPATVYQYSTIAALLAEARGDLRTAAEFARAALAAAAKEHSGLRYHPTAGLVGSEGETFADRLRKLAE